jgi:hypothetical protein
MPLSKEFVNQVEGHIHQALNCRAKPMSIPEIVDAVYEIWWDIPDVSPDRETIHAIIWHLIEQNRLAFDKHHLIKVVVTEDNK